jgi:energy-converting hydrogenase B subunit D
LTDVTQAIALLLVAAAGTAVVLTREPFRQVIVVSVFGFALSVLFFLFQAPDVALSQIAVGGVLLPAIILLALAKVRVREREAEEQKEQGDEA